MGKVKKLVTKPRLFFRDYLLNKIPLNYGENIELMAAEQATSNKQQATSNKQQATSNKQQAMEELYPITFPIDIVYTWVNANDENFNQDRLYHQNNMDKSILANKSEITDIARFESRDELKFSIRSIFEYAPWVNHIYIVTNGQVPTWLNKECDKISITTHSQIIDKQYLPTFNSHVIESSLHKIPNLSEHYIYFNDDVMLTSKLSPEYFFTSGGLVKVFMTNAMLPNSPKSIVDTPTQWASKNSRELLLQKTGFYSVNMFAHTFHPQLKSINEEIEYIWSDKIHKCRKNKFRGEDDLNIATFLHHHYALIQGKAISTRTKCMYFNIRSPDAKKYYQTLKYRKGNDFAPHSICLNDHKSNNRNVLERYEEKLQDFLEFYFPVESEAEITIPNKQWIAEQIRGKHYQEVYDVLVPLVSNCMVNRHNKKYFYVFYYLGVATMFMYQDTQSVSLLSKSNRYLAMALHLNEKHELAKKYANYTQDELERQLQKPESVKLLFDLQSDSK